VEAAFDLFTARVGEWCPTATHSIHEHDVKEVRLEGRVGGQGGGDVIRAWQSCWRGY
jgi:hypothetical protein